MEDYFANGEVNGRVLERLTIQKSESGTEFARFDLVNRFMDEQRPCACVAYGAIAQALVALADRGTWVAVRGEIRPFDCTLPTGKNIHEDNLLHITTFNFVDEPEALPAR